MTERRCKHHYAVETPSGMQARGVCKRCGLVRYFPSVWLDAVPDGKLRAMGRYRKKAYSEKVEAVA